MPRLKRISHVFVEYVPNSLEEGTVYVSVEYGTALHLCCCGCGNEVVTPLSPVDWKLIFDGETISLYPSIGNWGFECRSHYWIERGRVRWAYSWTDEEIAENREADKIRKAGFFSRRSLGPDTAGCRDGCGNPSRSRELGTDPELLE